MTTVHTPCAELARYTDEAADRMEQEIRALQEHARAILGDSDTAGITPACLCDFYEMTPAAHDELLGFEAEGVAGVVKLLEHLDTSEESAGDERWIHWLEFPRFVREHNWTDPLAVSRVAADIDQLFRLRRERIASTAEDAAVDASLTRLEEQVGRIDEKLAEIQRRVRAAGEDAGIAGPDADLPDADLSPEHIAELVEQLPADVVAEIDATARMAEGLAWQADQLVGRWEALEDALPAAVGSDQVHNGGDLVRAVEDRTRARVTEEVLTALGLTGSLSERDRLEVLRGHAVEPHDEVASLRSCLTLTMGLFAKNVLPHSEAEAIIWLLARLLHGAAAALTPR